MHPGKPGKYRNLIIRIPGLERTELLSRSWKYDHMFGAIFSMDVYICDAP